MESGVFAVVSSRGEPFSSFPVSIWAMGNSLIFILVRVAPAWRVSLDRDFDALSDCRIQRGSLTPNGFVIFGLVLHFGSERVIRVVLRVINWHIYLIQ